MEPSTSLGGDEPQRWNMPQKHATAQELSVQYAHRIKGKTVVVTGPTPYGLGAEFSQTIATSSPAMIILAGRTLSTLAKTAAAIKAINPLVKTPIVKLDLGSQASVRDAAAEINRWVDQIDVLVLNAGIMAVEYGLTVDGIEKQFGTNHIGHFLFANLLMPKLLAAGRGARVCSVSSEGHHTTGIRFDDLGFDDGKNYDKWLAYGQSKTANALFAVELARLLKGKDILAFAVHPGTIATGETGTEGTATSGIGRHLSADELKTLMGVEIDASGVIKMDRPETYKSLQEGAASHVYAAFDPNLAEHSGSYFADARVANDLAAPHALNAGDAKRLWEVSEKLVGEQFRY